MFCVSQRAQVESIRKELVKLQQNCRCPKTGREEEEGRRKREHDGLGEEEEGGPAKKRGMRRRRRMRVDQ